MLTFEAQKEKQRDRTLSYLEAIHTQASDLYYNNNIIISYSLVWNIWNDVPALLLLGY